MKGFWYVTNCSLDWHSQPPKLSARQMFVCERNHHKWRCLCDKRPIHYLTSSLRQAVLFGDICATTSLSAQPPRPSFLCLRSERGRSVCICSVWKSLAMFYDLMREQCRERTPQSTTTSLTLECCALKCVWGGFKVLPKTELQSCLSVSQSLFNMICLQSHCNKHKAEKNNGCKMCQTTVQQSEGTWSLTSVLWCHPTQTEHVGWCKFSFFFKNGKKTHQENIL